MNTDPYQLEATHLRDRRWAVHPLGTCGTCGWWPCAWTVQYVNASNAAEALRKAGPVFHKPKEAA